MRLNQYLAQALGWSRRQADKAIAGGHIIVNRKKAVLGQQIDPATDTVKAYGKQVPRAKKQKITIVLYKPKSYVSTRHDPQGRNTVMQLLPEKFQHLKPAGRLDYESEGLLILSSDGSLINTLTHPRYEKEKEYLVVFQRPVSQSLIATFKNGVPLKEGIAAVDSIQKLSEHEVRLRMHQGLNRQIRRMAETCNNTVTKLIRTAFGPYRLENLKPGEWRVVEPHD